MKHNPSSTSNMMRHLNIKHPTINPEESVSNSTSKFDCVECNQTFKQSYSLKRHLSQKHGIEILSVEKTIKCLLCEKMFAHQKSMVRHMKTHVDVQANNFSKNAYNEQNPVKIQLGNQPMHVDLQSQIPSGYEYSLIKYTSLEGKMFKAKFYIHKFGVDNIIPWIKEMREENKITFLKTSAKKSKNKDIIFKKRFRCHHNTIPKANSNPSKKHYNCKAILIIQIMKDEHVASDSSNMNIDANSSIDMNTKAIVMLKHIHNHQILRAEVLKHRIPSDNMKSTFLKLFEEGKTPSKALFTFKSELRNEKGNLYYKYAGDRGELPDPQWVYYLYYKTFQKHFGYSHGDKDDKDNNEQNNHEEMEIMKEFNEVLEKMKESVNSDKEYFLPSVKSFVNSYKKNVKTHASLSSAMETFGKYSGLNPNSKKPKLIGNIEIGTQPTARSRRTTQIGGRKTLTAGRCPKWKHITEHGYANKITSTQLPRKPFNTSQLPSKTPKMPHSLNYCVEENKSVGATHSAK